MWSPLSLGQSASELFLQAGFHQPRFNLEQYLKGYLSLEQVSILQLPDGHSEYFKNMPNM